MSTVDQVEAEHQPEPQDGSVTLTLSTDLMVASMSITPPLHGGEPVTMEHALAELATAKVVFGVDLQAVQELVATAAQQPGGVPGPKVVVARGRTPVNGENGAIIPHELLQTQSGYPQVREDGRVDFFQLNMVRNVKEGTVLATRQAPTRGVPGSDILGRPLPARDGADVKLKAGKGAKLAPDQQSVLAAIEGHASLSANGEVTVSPIFTVPEDVDFSTGNIDFVGTVIVRGNVNPGFVVKAAQNVEIHGGISGGVVEAGGDVIVRYGILGGSKGRVVAGGSVQCRFVEGAEIRVGGDLTVVDGILHARVQAGGKVSLTGSRGSIIGGQIRASAEVNCRILGSSAGTVTEVMVGVPPELRSEYERVRAALRQAEAKFTRAAQTVAFLRELETRNPEAVTPYHTQMIQQAMRSQNQGRVEREKYQVSLDALEAEIDKLKSGNVRAFEVAYPGVKIVIGSERFPLTDLYHRTCFFLSEEGVVATAPA